MKATIVLFLSALLFSCAQPTKKEKPLRVNWESRAASLPTTDSLVLGSSYLSVYSEIYDLTDETTHLLTATVSIRNISLSDSIFILSADYYDTHGSLIRRYVERPVYVLPMETLEIVIHRRDESGGTGANFNFDWATHNHRPEPLFEAVMIWTTGNQGISFTTQGVRR